MKMAVNSKDLIDKIQHVTKTTGSDSINFENNNGFLHLKSSNKGYVHHSLTNIALEECEDDATATIPVAQFTGMLNRRGSVDIVIDESSLTISNKTFKGEVIIPPPSVVDDIDDSDKTLELNPFVISEIQRHLPGLALNNLYHPVDPVVQVKCEKEILKLCILDSAHIAYYRINAEGQKDFSFELSHSDLTSLLNVIGENANADFAIEDSRVFVKDEYTVMSYPKQQPGSIVPFKNIDVLVNKTVNGKHSERLSGIHLELLAQEIEGCKHIASEKSALTISAKKTSYYVGYITPLGNIKTKGSCKNTWASDSVFTVDPFLFADFLNTASLMEEIDLVIVPDENKVYIYNTDDQGNISLHVCMGNEKSSKSK